MKRLLILLLLLAPAQAWAWMGVHVAGSGVPAASGCGLLDADFEGESNGTELSAITASWTETDASTNEFVTNTSVAGIPNGSVAASINWATGSGARLTKTFSEQTSGEFSVSFYFRTSEVATGSGTDLVHICDGDYSWFSTNALSIRQYENKLQYHNGTAFTDIATVVADTWYSIAITIDVDADT